MSLDLASHRKAPLLSLGALLLSMAFSGCCSCPEPGSDDDPEAAGGSGPSEEGSGGSAKAGRPFGASCDNDKQCGTAEVAGELKELICLTQFDGGYCSFESCSSKDDCPDRAHCVIIDESMDDVRFCFPDCTEEDECNNDRSSAALAVCTIGFRNGTEHEAAALKACLPPKE